MNQDTVVNLFTIFFIFTIFFNWYGILKVFGKSSLIMIKNAIKVTFGTKGKFPLESSLIGALSIISILVFPNYIPKFPTILMITIVGAVLTHVITPPFFLFLGTSSPETISLAYKLQFEAMPLKLVHLLESSHFGILSSQLESSDYRSTRRNWEGKVLEFMKIVPCIIIDIRFVSTAVRQEIEYIVTHNYQGKTILVTDDLDNESILRYVDRTIFSLSSNIIPREKIPKYVREFKKKLMKEGLFISKI